jgi:hypothetical protein
MAEWGWKAGPVSKSCSGLPFESWAQVVNLTAGAAGHTRTLPAIHDFGRRRK